ncbi:hypothetical protein [Empedobacter stercoris]|uniref:hypothetical protein n=1 Tax=Empedobacter stercoris TaxID=1628248 RepID=UPI001CE1E470|nr:hypothetical protein [Empedobacter stercoris]MCA4777190.1 hypothetical protein [Empedobacter stercoris]
MNTNDPIEDLFRSKSNETVGEKPRDLVWKRIEFGLQNEEKKKKPIREFISSVWFSAAVFALIAIPYFVLFIENINSENRENSLQVVQSNAPIIEQSPIGEEIIIIDSKDKIVEEPIEIVKNNKARKQPIYKVIEEKTVETIANQDYSIVSAQAAEAPLSVQQAMEARSQVLDSIDHEDQFAKVNLNKVSSDSIISDRFGGKVSGVVAANGVKRQITKQKDTSEVMKMTVVAEDRISNTSLETASLLEVFPKKSKVNKSTIIYKPLKFTVKSDILRTNFKLLNVSTSSTLVFESSTNSVMITFQKVKDQIILTTNQPKMDAVLLGILEKNKNEIFEFYSKPK